MYARSMTFQQPLSRPAQVRRSKPAGADRATGSEEAAQNEVAAGYNDDGASNRGVVVHQVPEGPAATTSARLGTAEDPAHACSAPTLMLS